MSRRLWAALAIGALIVAGLAAAWTASGGRPLSGDDWAFASLRVLMLVVVLSAVLAQGLSGRTTLKHGLIWLALTAVLLLGFTFREEIGFVGARVGAEIAPGAAVRTRPGEMMVARDADGAFYVQGQVNGMPVRFLVDTGASDVVLTPADAQRLGLDLAALDFSHTYQTANGVGRGAYVRVASLSVGDVAREDFSVSVNGAAMESSLLGMSFFRHLESFEIRGDKLYLRWRN